MSLFRPNIRLRSLFSPADALILLALFAFIYGLLGIGKEWTGILRPVVEIDLSPWALPRYTAFSLFRGFAAYAISLLFTLAYGYTAAYVPKADRILLPLLDILQSIPVLGFLPGLVLTLVAIFPHSNLGLELAAVLMIFTGQAWNMTFSFYSSLKTIPADLLDAAGLYRFGWWRRFTKLELPYSSIGLVWNSMMSMAGGWFFLTVSEAFILGTHDFRLPGIGSYMSVAINAGNLPAMISAIIAMTLMIVGVDQLFWRPVVAWSQKFKFEQTQSESVPHSAILDLLERSHILAAVRDRIAKPFVEALSRRVRHRSTGTLVKKLQSCIAPRSARRAAGWGIGGIMILIVVFASYKFAVLVSGLGLAKWGMILGSAALTFLRAAVAVVLGSLWTIPTGVAIGLKPKLSRFLQPAIQVVASFPAPMLFPLVLMGLAGLGMSIDFGAIVLMLLGTQWYILFNVIAGAMSIPTELRDVSSIFRVSRRDRWRRLILPAIFPSLVTGWVTATGGAWNASIVAEYVQFKGRTLVAHGLGSTISLATERGDFALLAASIALMAVVVVGFNRLVWKRLYRIAEQRFSLNV